MSVNTGFDNEKYLSEQSKAIIERVDRFDGKLYLEFGGKLIFDYHASRVLPGFDPNVKIRLLQKLKDKADIILCIYAGDIERKKIRADFGITYDKDVLKLVDELGTWGIQVTAIVITRFTNQPSATQFKKSLERRGIKVYTHGITKGYPTNVDVIASDEGYGANTYIKTTKPLVVVTGPGPGSGKMATCLNQLYHEYKKGKNAGYAKFETFPIWNIPLNHPVNVAYEAATADLGDVNIVDPYHLETYNKTSINYNRDIEIFPVLKAILEKISGKASVYNSPTDMGVNRVGFGITDDSAVREAAKQEVIRRYFRYRCEYIAGLVDAKAVERVENLMKSLDVKKENRKVYGYALSAADEAQKEGKGNEGIFCGAAIELKNGAVITGKNSQLMHAASSLIINTVKCLADIPAGIHLLSPAVIDSIASLKKNILSQKALSLDLEETLIALSISATTNPTAQIAMEKLKNLRGCEVHMTHMPTPGDEQGLRKLGVNLTSDPNYSSNSLFIS